MKRVYLRPETTKVRYDVESFIAASPKTQWEMNPDGNNGEDIPPGGSSNDPDADAKGWSGIDLWGDDLD